MHVHVHVCMGVGARQGFHRVKLSLEYPFIKFVVTPKIYGLRRQLYCSDPAKCTKGVSTPATPTPGRS